MDTTATIKQVYDLISDIQVKGEDTIKIANVILVLRQLISELSKEDKEEKDG